jgi:hypothetical protein
MLKNNKVKGLKILWIDGSILSICKLTKGKVLTIERSTKLKVVFVYA